MEADDKRAKKSKKKGTETSRFHVVSSFLGSFFLISGQLGRSLRDSTSFSIFFCRIRWSASIGCFFSFFFLVLHDLKFE